MNIILGFLHIMFVIMFLGMGVTLGYLIYIIIK